MKKLHGTQESLLNLLSANLFSPLTMRELQEQLSISSTSVVYHHIMQLEKKGYLKRNPHNSKDYVILSEPERPIAYLNQYGLAQCGPHGSILDGNPVDKIPIASKLLKFPINEAFLLEATGDSMEPKIRPGDLIIARRQNYADNNDIVVCINDLQVIIKQYQRHGSTIILHSLNNSKHPPFIASEDFRIEGVVKNILQYH